jgi:hypothetical protein
VLSSPGLGRTWGSGWVGSSESAIAPSNEDGFQGDVAFRDRNQGLEPANEPLEGFEPSFDILQQLAIGAIIGDVRLRLGHDD